MNKSEYQEKIFSLSIDGLGTKVNTKADELLLELSKAEKHLFQDSETIQPIKWHQITRIYNLAVIFIRIIKILWPYISLIIKVIKK